MSCMRIENRVLSIEGRCSFFLQAALSYGSRSVKFAVFCLQQFSILSSQFSTSKGGVNG